MTPNDFDPGGAAPPLPGPVAGLAREVRADVAALLEQQAHADQAQGRGTDTVQERAEAGRALIAEAMTRRVREAMLAGVTPPSRDLQDQAAREVFDALYGLGRLQPLLDEDDVEDIHINGCDRVFVRHTDGRSERRAPVADSDAELVEMIRTFASRLGVGERRFDSASPILDLHLPDGSRLFAVTGVSDRPWAAVRRHRLQRVRLTELQHMGMLDERLAGLLTAAVKARRNILISGATGAGKTTLLRALAAEISPQERICTIEDTLELGLHHDTDAHPDARAMEARLPNTEGEGGISAADLVRAALRASPDRVIVGETRGPETVALLQAMSQGNDGSMATIHASSSAGAFTRIATYAILPPDRLPMEATALLVAGAIHLVVHLTKTSGNVRFISSVREVTGSDGPQVVSNEIFEPGPDRRARPAAPLRAETVAALEAAGAPAAVTRGTPAGWTP